MTGWLSLTYTTTVAAPPTTNFIMATRLSNEPLAEGTNKRSLIALAFIVLVGLSFQIPWLDRPFGAAEPNPGIYFGPFTRNFEKFGFAACRGVPLGPSVVQELPQGIPYMRHPPGLSWFLYAAGTTEWQIRLATALTGIAAAVLLFFLLVPTFGIHASAFGAAVLELAPNVASYSLGSYENVVIALGLLLLLMLRRAADRRTRFTLCAIVAAAAIGPWIDWTFAFFCAASIPICWMKRPIAIARRLVLPATVSLASLLVLLWWRQWAIRAPGMRDMPVRQSSLGDLFADFVFSGPPLADFLLIQAEALTRSLTPLLFILTLAGLWPAWRRDRRLALALALSGILPLIAFASHSDWVFFTFLIPLAAMACAALFCVPVRVDVRLRGLAAGAVLVLLAVSTWRANEESDTEFFRDFGRIASEASQDRIGTAAGTPYRVIHSLPTAYGYYIDSPNVIMTGVGDLNVIRQLLNSPSEMGLKFLWIQHTGLPNPAAFEEFLKPFPKVRHPELETQVNAWGQQFGVDGAWMVTLREPR